LFFKVSNFKTNKIVFQSGKKNLKMMIKQELLYQD